MVFLAAVDAVILSIGTELTLGQTVDTNAAWLSARLGDMGVSVLAHVVLPDDESAIVGALRRETRIADVVVVSGGLGPTEDDLTRHALARAMGSELVEDPECWRVIEEYFAKRSYKLSQDNRRQALVPKGARPMINPCGTAPGLEARVNRARVFCLPGVPAEMRAMYAEAVEPVLRAAAGGRAICSRTVLTFGQAEAEINRMLGELMRPGRHPAVGTLASEAVIGVRVVATGDSPASARELLRRDVEEVRARLGDLVFGEEGDTLAGAVGRLLAARGETLSVAESCTGGMLAKMITDVSGSSAYLIDGVVTYANEAKTRLLDVPPELIEAHGAVSAEVAGAMVRGCRSRSGSDYALATTGVAGPTGGTAAKPVGLVYVALDRARGTEVRELRVGEMLGRDSVRIRACRSVLNLLRKRLLASGGDAGA
jgi:nicotinamide-nucleotide amidase